MTDRTPASWPAPDPGKAGVAKNEPPRWARRTAYVVVVLLVAIVVLALVATTRWLWGKAFG